MKPPRRRGRGLSGEEARLWGEVAKLVTPLRGRAVPAETPTLDANLAPKPDESSRASTPVEAQVPSPVREKDRVRGSPSPEKSGPSPLPPPARERGPVAPTPTPSSQKRALKLGDLAPPGPARPAPPPFKPAPVPPGLERRERQRLQRGLLPIEARIDLHGLYQAEAHDALVGFLMRARASGFARVLVVTGKGGAADTMFSERGVLRRSVPHWLRGPELRAIVLGFEEAGRQHGGAGALYVRLRRR